MSLITSEIYPKNNLKYKYASYFLTILTYLFVYQGNIRAQNFSWAKIAAAGTKDFGRRVCTSPNGDAFSLTIQVFGDSRLYFLTCYDRSGNQKWKSTITGAHFEVTNINSDKEGNLFLSIFYTDKIYIGNTSFNSGVPLDAPWVSLLYKLNPEGEVKWGRNIQNGNLFILSHNSRLIVQGGYFNTTSDVLLGSNILIPGPHTGDRYIAEIDGEGNVLNYSDADGSLWIFGSEDGSYLTGEIYNEGLWIGRGAMRRKLDKGGGKTYLAKYDTEFNLKWVKQFKHDLIITDVLACKNGSAYITGCFHQLLVDSTLYTAPGGTRNGFLSKVNDLGNFLWIKFFKTDNPITIRNIYETNEKLIVGGDVTGNFVYEQYSSPGSTTRIFFSTFDLDGNIESTHFSSGQGGVVMSPSFSMHGNTAYFTGELGNNAEVCFDNHCFTESQAAYVAAIDLSEVLTVKEVYSSPQLRIFPNPATKEISILHPGSRLKAAHLLDNQGKVIESLIAEKQEGQILRFQLPELAPGKYFISLEDESKMVRTGTFIIGK